MPLDPPTREPGEFFAGDTVTWSKTLRDYSPVDGWVLAYNLVGPSAPVTQPVVVATGDRYDVTLAATATADPAFATGTYRLIGYVTLAGERHVVFNDLLEILPNPASVTYAALQTHVDRMLAACEAALEGRLTADVARYGREGVFVEKLPIEQVLRFQGIYKAKQWRAQHQGVSYPNHLLRFGPTEQAFSEDEIGAWPEIAQW